MTRNVIILECVWIDDKYNIRTWTKCFYNKTRLGTWVMSTFLITEKGKYIRLRPAKVFYDPFKRDNYYVVLCEMYNFDDSPYISNNRKAYTDIINDAQDLDLWFVMEQKCAFALKNGKNPLSITKYSKRCASGQNYGGMIIDKCIQKALQCGVRLDRINSHGGAEWSFQIGPTYNTNISDYIWMTRYILTRVAESFDLIVQFYPTNKNNNTRSLAKDYGNLYLGSSKLNDESFFNKVYQTFRDRQNQYYQLASGDNYNINFNIGYNYHDDPNPGAYSDIPIDEYYGTIRRRTKKENKESKKNKNPEKSKEVGKIAREERKNERMKKRELRKQKKKEELYNRRKTRDVSINRRERKLQKASFDILNKIRNQHTSSTRTTTTRMSAKDRIKQLQRMTQQPSVPTVPEDEHEEEDTDVSKDIFTPYNERNINFHNDVPDLQLFSSTEGDNGYGPKDDIQIHNMDNAREDGAHSGLKFILPVLNTRGSFGQDQNPSRNADPYIVVKNMVSDFKKINS